jgi:hypothetical protein
MLIVSHDGRWPWAKQIMVEDDTTLAFTPFNIDQNLSTSLIATSSVEKVTLPDGTEYESAAKLFAAHNDETTIVSSDGSIELRITDTNLVATWRSALDNIASAFCASGNCDQSLTVFPTDVNVTRAMFLPGSRDHVIFAARNLISVIEIDATGTPQNIQPVYRSIKENMVDFALVDQTVYVRDGETIIAVDL